MILKKGEKEDVAEKTDVFCSLFVFQENDTAVYTGPVYMATFSGKHKTLLVLWLSVYTKTEQNENSFQNVTFRRRTSALKLQSVDM